MGFETEARFRAERRATLDRLASRPSLGPAALGPPQTVLEVDRYLDTDDRRLSAAHWACRLRSRGASLRVSLKGPPDPATDTWLHRRPEIEGPATQVLDPAAWPSGEARDLLLELSGGTPLRERLRLTQERTERSVTDAAGHLGTLSLDAVVAEQSGTQLGELYLVELEVRADGDAAERLRPLARVLTQEPGLSPEPRTKLELALGLPLETPIDRASTHRSNRSSAGLPDG